MSPKTPTSPPSFPRPPRKIRHASTSSSTPSPLPQRRRSKVEFINTSREAFRIAHDVSAYSLVALARAAASLMTGGGSIIAMTYYGAEKVVPHYNVMGVAKAALESSARYLAYDLGPKKIRVNCISAGPVNTLAARGIAVRNRNTSRWPRRVSWRGKNASSATKLARFGKPLKLVLPPV